MSGFKLGKEALAQLRKVVREERSRHKNARGHRARWTKRGTTTRCPARNEIQQVAVLGMPTGSTLDLIVAVPDDQADQITETVQLNWNDGASAITTALEGHSGIEAGDVQVTGTLPNSTVQIEFLGRFAGVDIPIMQADWSALTGGSGVGVVISVVHDGFPRRKAAT